MLTIAVNIFEERSGTAGMKRERAYWLCQIFGWAIHFGFQAAATVFRTDHDWRLLTISGPLTLLGLTFTHFLRRHIKRNRWFELEPWQLLARGVGSAILLGMLLTLATLTIRWPAAKTLGLEPWGMGEILLLFTNWSGLIVIWQILYFGIHFFQDHKRTEIEMWKLKADFREAELKALRSQINPHFIFNMLNSIRALITEDPQRAKAVVTQMSRLLRASLRSDRGMLVPLERELAMARDYLELEEIRFEERLQYRFLTDPSADRVSVPAMLVHTLVENGIKHGIATRPEGGEIVVETRCDGASVFIRVSNSGCLEPNRDDAGIGLANVLERLRLHYGDRSRLTLRDAGSETVIAEVVVPREQEA